MSFQKVLIVDDEAPIREMIKLALELEGFTCLQAQSASEALPIIVDQRPDLVVLDWMMPDVSGLDFLRRLKRDDNTREIPVIMLTAKTEENSVVNGLDAGADDYISKPFRPRELISRIQAIMRRISKITGDGLLVVGELCLDMKGHCVFVDDQLVAMGPTEYNLLKFFMGHPDRSYSRAQLLDQVWGSNVYVEERTVDVHIRRLRKALKPAADGVDCGRFIQTVRGAGYRFSARLASL